MVLFQLFYLPQTAAKNFVSFVNQLWKKPASHESLQFGTIDRIKKSIGFDVLCSGIVEYYAQCTHCFSTYILKEPSRLPPEYCVFSDLGDHCNQPLFQNYATKNPRKLLVYQSLKHHLKKMACRPGFEKVINHYKFRDTPDKELNDVYDGYVWKHIQAKNKAPFFNNDPEDDHEIRLGIAINLDWANMFSSVSSGAMYTTILNLPRSERFKPYNLLLSFMFNGEEPPTTKLNQAIEPLIEELQDLYINGLLMTTYESRDIPAKVRVVLVNTSSHNPAARKVREYKHINLDMIETNRQARKWASIRDKAKREAYTKKHGLRWSHLQSLCYYNVHRQTTTDAMHGLFLSQTSLLMKLYEEFDLIKPFDYEATADATTSIMLPSKYERFDRSLRLGFAWMKADGYRVWLLLFGPYILYRISDYCHHSIRIKIKGKGLSKAHFDNFLDYHLACRLILQPSLTKEDVGTAQKYFTSYNRSFVALFGAEHLVHTWCFAYESFVERSHSMSYIKQFESVLEKDQRDLLYKVGNSNGHMGNLSSNAAHHSMDYPNIDKSYYKKKRHYYRLSSCDIPLTTGSEVLPDQADDAIDDDKKRSSSLDEQTFGFLLQHYRKVYGGIYTVVDYSGNRGDGDSSSDSEDENVELASSSSSTQKEQIIVIGNVVIKKASCNIEGLMYRSLLKGSKTGSGIQAYFQGSYGAGVGLYPGVVLFYFDHYVDLPDKGSIKHRFACCKWFARGPRSSAVQANTRNTVEVWKSSFEKPDRNCLLPVQRIYGQIAVDVKTPNAYVIPVIRKVYL
ncbi:conserved hypothetical protein [Mucor ambiguus]|uniref:Transposase domain-containing protein n=1 Tax=Mucor ambiguus TaxID=91626 RepID=A0A0C9N473_9FUNG|nr:conserved hypothetical protein [Mucor ambiguus]